MTNVGSGAVQLIKNGGGTLVLAGANNTYGGATTVNEGTLLVNGTLTAGGGIVTVAGGAVLGGTGSINRAVTIAASGTIKPGTSPGRLTVGGDVAISANASYFWELSANTTSGGGTNWSQITMTSGDLGVASGANLVPAFIGSATQPNSGDAFWQATRRWDNVIDLTGTATNSSGQTSFLINNSAWSAFGSFTTIPAVVGSGVALQWTPVPEPLHMFALCVAIAAVVGGSRKKSR